MDDDAVKCGDVTVTLTELLAAARERGVRFTVSRKAYGSPRSVTSNAHGFRIAVHRVTGEIRILYSVHATDAGVVINPTQVRGQIEGGVARRSASRSPRISTSTRTGVMVNPNLRNYRIPTYADVPRTEVLVVESHRLGRADGGQGNRRVERQPGGPALANALQDATGVRYRELPLTPERIYRPARFEQVDSRQPDGAWTPRSHPTPPPRSSSGERVRRRLGAGIQGLAAGNEPKPPRMYPGFIGAEITPPTPSSPIGSWSTASTPIAHVRRGSTAPPQERLAEGRQYLSTAPPPNRWSAVPRSPPTRW